jgi:hypothetical protein
MRRRLASKRKGTRSARAQSLAGIVPRSASVRGCRHRLSFPVSSSMQGGQRTVSRAALQSIGSGLLGLGTVATRSHSVGPPEIASAYKGLFSARGVGLRQFSERQKVAGRPAISVSERANCLWVVVELAPLARCTHYLSPGLHVSPSPQGRRSQKQRSRKK